MAGGFSLWASARFDASAQTEDDLTRLQGEWLIIDGEGNGERVRIAEDRIRLTFEGPALTITNPHDEFISHATISLQATAEPNMAYASKLR